jgi:hypothetical protein
MPKAARSKPARRVPASRRTSVQGRDPGVAFSALADAALQRGEPDAIPDQALHAVLAAAVRVYAAKAERRGGFVKPFADGAVTATEAVVAACGMIRAADLNPFDMAMWFHRLPAN